MDENTFFREAVLRICGNLEIEDAMFSILKFLREEMPVDRIFLQFVDVGLKSLRMVAMTTIKKTEKVDLLTPLSSKAFQEITDMIDEYHQQKKSNFIWIFKDNPKENAAIREFFELHEMKVTSLMIMPLGAVGEVLGGDHWYLLQKEIKNLSKSTLI